MAAILCHSAVNQVWKSLVLTGNIIHHPHIILCGVARFISVSARKAAGHLVVTVERHRDVWYEQVERCAKACEDVW